MKLVLIILVHGFLVTGVFAQSTSTSVTELDGEISKSGYIGANLGGSLGGTGLGLTYGKRLNENNILEFNYKSWSDRDVKGLEFSGAARVVYNGQAVGVSNKYFFYKSFNIKTGVIYRTSTVDIPAGLNVINNGTVISERNISDISGEISLGNQWFGKRWGLAIDWFGYTPTFVELDNIPGFQRSNLQVLNFTLSYSF